MKVATQVLIHTKEAQPPSFPGSELCFQEKRKSTAYRLAPAPAFTPPPTKFIIASVTIWALFFVFS